MQQSSQTPLDETQRLAQAQEAIRAIGAPKALPTILSRLKTKESPIRAWIIEKANKYHVRFLQLNSATECQLQGVAGFEVLGTNCAAAVGELTKLLSDPELAFLATSASVTSAKPRRGA